MRSTGRFTGENTDIRIIFFNIKRKENKQQTFDVDEEK